VLLLAVYRQKHWRIQRARHTITRHIVHDRTAEEYDAPICYSLETKGRSAKRSRAYGKGYVKGLEKLRRKQGKQSDAGKEGCRLSSVEIHDGVH
jgi:hypothetical protein